MSTTDQFIYKHLLQLSLDDLFDIRCPHMFPVARFPFSFFRFPF